MHGSNLPPNVSPLSFKLRPEERERLREAATAAGVGPSSFAADAVRAALGTARRRPLPRRADALAQAVRDATGQLGAIGNNLNQLARVANSGGGVDTRLLANIRDVLAAVDAELEDVALAP